MKPPQPSLVAPNAYSVMPRRGRDPKFGRVTFLPPLLINPRAIFDPLPFRTQFMGEWQPATPRKAG